PGSVDAGDVVGCVDAVDEWGHVAGAAPATSLGCAARRCVHPSVSRHRRSEARVAVPAAAPDGAPRTRLGDDGGAAQVAAARVEQQVSLTLTGQLVDHGFEHRMLLT